MILVRLTNEMKDLLKKLKGKTFVGYSATEIYQGETVYDGIIYVQTDSVFIKISNKEIEIPWFGEGNKTEHIFSFHCEEVEEIFGIRESVVKENIEKIELVNDTIKIPTQNYEITLDMAVIISTKTHKYIISRGWMFGEYLDVNVDKNLDAIYSVAQVVEEWNNFGEWEVFVERTIEQL